MGRQPTSDIWTAPETTRHHRPSDLGRLIADLYDSGINVSISWLWDDGIHLRIGNPMRGYRSEAQVQTLAEAADWLRGEALRHFPDTRFARQYRRDLWRW